MHHQGELASPRTYLRRALEINEKVYGPDHPAVAIRANNIGLVLDDLGDLAGARETLERALIVWTKFLGRITRKRERPKSNRDREGASADHPPRPRKRSLTVAVRFEQSPTPTTIKLDD